jgi:hypothetical protein
LFHQFVGFQTRQSFCLQQKVLFHLRTHNLSQDKLAYAHRAQRQGSLVEAPSGNNAAGEDIRVEEQSNSPLTFDFPWFLDCGRRFFPEESVLL